ncbi:MAG: fibrinogen-like YCDxxxxGGGW domain-containing protein [Patescibacteria group bacterium]
MNQEIETGDKTVLSKIVNLNKYGFAKSCKELLDNNSDLQDKDGIYTLSYNKTEIYDVHCDMTTDG